MSGQTEELIAYRMDKAAETLDAARILFREEKNFSAVNRIYYAAFYAVSALLLTKGLSSSKHAGVLSLFNQEFVNKDLADKDSGRFFNRMYHYRQKGDYQDYVEFGKADVEKWLKRAEKFIQDIQQMLGGTGASD